MPTSIKCHIRGQFGPNKQHLIASDCSPVEQRSGEVFKVHFTFLQPQNKSKCSDLSIVLYGFETFNQMDNGRKQCCKEKM